MRARSSIPFLRDLTPSALIAGIAMTGLILVGLALALAGLNEMPLDLPPIPPRPSP